jgi:hypothetical protein
VQVQVLAWMTESACDCQADGEGQKAATPVSTGFCATAVSDSMRKCLAARSGSGCVQTRIVSKKSLEHSLLWAQRSTIECRCGRAAA